jgi:arsenate reductase
MHGKNPLAIDVMREAGVDISLQESTRLTDQNLAVADYVVTVCGHADENCPVLPARVRKEHRPLDEPAKVVGAEEAVMVAFRDSRDDIRLRVEDFIHRLSDELRQERND